jgi:hypothetical protein
MSLIALLRQNPASLVKKTEVSAEQIQRLVELLDSEDSEAPLSASMTIVRVLAGNLTSNSYRRQNIFNF